MNRGRRAGWAAAALLVLAGCGTGEPGVDPTSAGATPQQTIPPTDQAVAALLPADDVPPAPPGTFVDSTGPVPATGVIGEPSRQVMTCTPLELTGADEPGPAEAGAIGAASSSSVIGMAQIDQYAVVYADDTAAQSAVDRARDRADDCDKAFAVHSPDAAAQRTITAAPGTVDGFRVHATYAYADTGNTSDETSAVLRSGPIVLYLRANETGSGPNAGEDSDGILDPAWADQLIETVAAHVAS